MNSPKTDQQIKNRKAAWFWCTIVVCMLSLQVGLGVTAIYLSKSDKSVAVIPDYYRKASTWDESQAAHTRYESLDCETFFQLDQDQVLNLIVESSNALPFDQITVNYFRRSRGSEVYTRTFDAHTNPNRWTLALSEPHAHHGTWEFELHMTDSEGNAYATACDINVSSLWQNLGIPEARTAMSSSSTTSVGRVSP